jgi:hypothetical protein
MWGYGVEVTILFLSCLDGLDQHTEYYDRNQLDESCDELHSTAARRINQQACLLQMLWRWSWQG